MINKQQGAMLAVTLFFLLVIAILSVGALTASLLNMRMSQNTKATILALHQAQSGINAASLAIVDSSLEQKCLVPENISPLAFVQIKEHLSNPSLSCSVSGGAATTKYLIEVMQRIKRDCFTYYRITSTSSLANSGGLATVQATFLYPTMDIKRSPSCQGESVAYQGKVSWRELV